MPLDRFSTAPWRGPKFHTPLDPLIEHLPWVADFHHVLLGVVALENVAHSLLLAWQQEGLGLLHLPEHGLLLPLEELVDPLVLDLQLPLGRVMCLSQL